MRKIRAAFRPQKGKSLTMKSHRVTLLIVLLVLVVVGVAVARKLREA